MSFQEFSVSNFVDVELKEGLIKFEKEKLKKANIVKYINLNYKNMLDSRFNFNIELFS